MLKDIQIGKHSIGLKHKPYVIAEMSGNHNHFLERALEIVDAVAAAGANAIKLQTYTADTMTIKGALTITDPSSPWYGRELYELYQEAYTPWEWHEPIFKRAKERGLDAFSSPFDGTAVDFLETMEVPAYKVASFEITDIPLIEYIASKGKPVIISTGIATLVDIEEAVNACRRAGNNDIALLKCTSSYPAPIAEANLLTIPHLRDTFSVVAGLSDHTMGSDVAIAAVALGAKIIEKHFILDRELGGPDSAFSTEPEEFKQMVTSIRNVEKALGKINYQLSPKVEKSRIFARSLFIVKDVNEGELITKENIRSIRPGNGLHPKYYYQIMGKKFRKDFKMGAPLSWEMFE